MRKQATPKPTVSTIAAAAERTPVEPRETKIGKVIALLERKNGATLNEMIGATGWLAHTTRVALTGFKKKGHPIERDKRDDEACYRITKGA